MASPAIARASGWAGACDGSVRTPSAGRSRRTISSVGPRPQSSSSSSTSGPVASVSKPVGLRTRSSRGPRASGPDRSRWVRTSGSRPVMSTSVASKVAYQSARTTSCGTFSLEKKSVTSPRSPTRSGQTDCRPSSRTTRLTGAGDSKRSTVSQPSSTARERISCRVGHSGRGVKESADVPSSSQMARAVVRTPGRTRSARSSPRSRTVTATRSYLPGSTWPSGPMTAWERGDSSRKALSASPGPISRPAPAARAGASAAGARAASTAWSRSRRRAHRPVPRSASAPRSRGRGPRGAPS